MASGLYTNTGLQSSNSSSSAGIDLTGLNDPFGTDQGIIAPTSSLGPAAQPDFTGLSTGGTVQASTDPTTADNGFATGSGSTNNASVLPSGYGTDASTAAGSTGLSSLINSLTSSGVGNLALYGGLYGLLSSQATSAANQNNNLAQQIINVGQGDVNAGNSMLSTYQSGGLTSPFQQTVTNAEAQNQLAATSQAQQVTQLLANSSSGNLQSAVASEGQQITSNQALQNSTAVANAFQAELASSLNLTNTGGQYIQAGINTEIQSNTQLQGQLASLMGMLANAYAKSTSGSGGSGSGGSGSGAGAGSGGSSSFGSLVNSLLKGSSSGDTSIGTNATNLTNQVTDPALTQMTNSVETGASNSLADTAGQGASDLANNASDLANADQGGDVLTGINSLSSDASWLGNFSGAGGQAATAATDGGALGAAATAGAEDSVAQGALSAASTANDIADAGQAAAGAQDAVSAASSGASAAGGIGLGTVAGAVGAPLAVYGAASSWNQNTPGKDAISGATAGASLGAAAGAMYGAEVGSSVGPIGTIAGAIIGAVISGAAALLKGPHTQETITNPSQPGDELVKDQSGNSVLVNTQTGQGGVGFGAGTSRGQGSAQWFIDPATSGTLDYNAQTGQQNLTAKNGDPTVEQGNLYWLGQTGSQDLTNFANGVGADAPTMVNGKPNFSVADAAYAADPTAGTGIVGIYNNNGGQAVWGENFDQWVQSIWDAKNGVTGNLSTGGGYG